MELWGKQCAYIPRRFVMVEVVEHDHFDRGRGGRARPSRPPSLGRVLWPEDLPRGHGAG
jgi:hypothetical protein